MEFPKPKVEDLLEVDSFKGKKHVNGARVANVMRLSWKTLTVEQARQASEHYSKLYAKNANPKVAVLMNASMNIPKLGYRTGFMVSAGDHIPFYSYTDYDSWKGKLNGVPYDSNTVLPNFDLYVYQFPNQPTAGKGFDKKTHCFYLCIITMFENGLIHGIKGPKSFKKRFKLKPDDAVPIELVPCIEKTLGISITIIGDHVYTSQSKSPRKIKLMLKNGHYTIVHPEERKTYCYWSPHDRIPITRYLDLETNLLICYDGEKRFELTDNDVQILHYHPKDAKYVVVTRNNNDEDTLESDWENFKALADKLKQKSKGRINLYQTGNYKNTAMKLFHDFGYSLDIIPEEMEYDESIWHEECYNGGIIKAEISHEKWKRLYKFDISSLYPSVMASGNTVPIKKGEFKIASEEIMNKQFLPKGIFRAVVEEGSKLFVYNKNNKYWNHELNIAKNKLNLKVTIIQDGANNFLEYTAEKCIPLKTLYGKFVHFLYPLKQYESDEDVNKAIKAILIVLWGAHSEKYKIKKVITKSDAVVKFREEENCKFEGVESVTKNKIRVIQTRYTNIYKGEFPRVKSYITSQGRCVMYELLYNVIDDVKSIRTDGFLCTHKEFQSVLKKDAKLGNLVYEGYYKDITIDKTMTDLKVFKFHKA